DCLEKEKRSVSMNASPVERLLERVRGEYLEMPGLRLTFQQMQRLCGIEQTMCQVVLDTLVETNFLCVKSDGHYALSPVSQVMAEMGRQAASGNALRPPPRPDWPKNAAKARWSTNKKPA